MGLEVDQFSSFVILGMTLVAVWSKSVMKQSFQRGNEGCYHHVIQLCGWLHMFLYGSYTCYLMYSTKGWDTAYERPTSFIVLETETKTT